MKLREAGDHAVLVVLDDNTAVHTFAARVRAQLAGVVEEVVPGHETVLISWPPYTADVARIRATLLELDDAATPSATVPAEVQIDVIYDGPDLEHVASSSGLSVAEVIAAHRAARYTAAFVGFTPGFAYLVGGDPRLALPRRPTPRTKVPAGAVAIAGGYSAVYPCEGPGGWHLIGRTKASLFDPRRTEPALITPGTRVTFAEAR